MAEFNLNTELMTNMEIVTRLSSHSGTTVYTVRSTKSNHLYALKHISIPENQNQVDALILTGAASDRDAAQAYYEQVVTDYQEELEMLEQLSANINLGNVRSYEIKPKVDEIGFDIFLLSEYRTTLEQHAASHALSQSDAVNLAVDLCSALCGLREAGLIHRDIKPSNIFLDAQGHFVLGDLGIAKIEGMKFCSMPDRMLSSYSAPELFDLIANVNETIDIYSVGLILYRLYNGGHGPLEDERTSAKAADKLRITGQALPAPMFADYEMAEIICKACAFKPEDRFQTPEQMKQAITEYMLRNQVGDEPLTPPIIADDEPVDLTFSEEPVEPVQFANTDDMDDTFKESFSPDNDMLNSLIETVHKDLSDTSEEAKAEDHADVVIKPRKRRGFTKWFPTVLVFVVLAALIVTAVWFFFIRKDTLTVDGFEIVDRGVDSITVKLTTEEDPETFKVICTDPYGSKSVQDYVPGEANTFTDLAAGAQYVISVEGFKKEHVEGAVPHNASTKSTTQILNLSISRQTVGEIELTFVPDGAEPKEWIVSYGPVGQKPASKTFTGHTVILSGLEPDTEYEISLPDPSDVQLTGQTTLTGKTLPSVTLVPDGVLAELNNSTATITWEFVGNAPASWNVTTTGSKGYTDNQTVLENKIVLDDLQAGETYSLVITCDNMVGSASTSFTLEAFSITQINHAVNENGGIDISWTCAADQKQAQWMVVYTPVGNESMTAVEQTSEQSVTLTKLIPGTTYHIEIQEASGEQVGGNNTTDIDVPPAESYTNNGFTKGYVVLYPRPAQEKWNVNNLTGHKSTFAASETIAFACQTISQIKSKEETITTMLVVRDANGSVVDYYAGQAEWSSMWTNKCYVGELQRTPSEPGNYTLELYFNGKRVKTDSDIKFTISP